MIEPVSQSKTLPFSEESERAVLAAILLDSERHLPPTAGRLRADDFYPELARRVRDRAATVGEYTEPVTLPTQAELPVRATPPVRQPVTIEQSLRELLLPDEPG